VRPKFCGRAAKKNQVQRLAELKTFGNLYIVITTNPPSSRKTIRYIFISNPFVSGFIRLAEQA